MAATGYEVTGSRYANKDGIKRKYRVENAEDEEDVLTFIATLPSTLAGFPAGDFNFQEIEEEVGSYDLTFEWGKPDRTTSEESQQPVDSTEYKFSFLAPSARISQSLATIASYAAQPDPEPDPPVEPANFGGAINVVADTNGAQRVEGVDLSPPAEVFTLTYKATDAEINSAYQLTVEGLVGKVNSTTFRGREAGSLMLVRAQGSRSQGIWTVDFGFAYIANATNIPVGENITVTSKDGFDLLWAYYGAAVDDNAKTLIVNPIYAYVERVYPRADLNGLSLPA